MKKLVLLILKNLADLALFNTRVNVNSICFWTWYQPNLPRNAEKIRKN